MDIIDGSIQFVSKLMFFEKELIYKKMVESKLEFPDETDNIEYIEGHNKELI